MQLDVGEPRPHLDAGVDRVATGGPIAEERGIMSKGRVGALGISLSVLLLAACSVKHVGEDTPEASAGTRGAPRENTAGAGGQESRPATSGGEGGAAGSQGADPRSSAGNGSGTQEPGGSGAAGSAGAGATETAGAGSGDAETPIDNSAETVAKVAQGIYDAQAAGEDLGPYISEVMASFGVPTLDNADTKSGGVADQRLEKGLPLLTSTLVAGMADAYADGSLVSVDDFVAGLIEQGAVLRFPYSMTGEPLSKEMLGVTLTPYAMADVDQYEPGQVLPALVVALGKERAERRGIEAPDPVWADGNLDPLQFVLMLYTIMAPAPSDAAGSQGSLRTIRVPVQGLLGGLGGFVADQIRDQITSEVQTVVEVPLDQKEAAQVSVCASLLLYGHKVTMTNQPKLLWHRRAGVDSVTTVDALLEFQDDYYDNYLAIDHWVLEKLANCTLPRRGPIGGKPVAWSVSSGLEGHGDYDITASETDDDGKAVASWRTVPEDSAQCYWTFPNQRDAVGATIAKVSNLVPGWGTLERIVGFLRDTGNAGDAPLTVLYYVESDDKDCHPD
jgi:hypothetical protein